MNKMTFGLVIDFCISCKFLNFRTKTLPIQFLCQMPIKNRFSLMNYSELWLNEEFKSYFGKPLFEKGWNVIKITGTVALERHFVYW